MKRWAIWIRENNTMALRVEVTEVDLADLTLNTTRKKIHSMLEEKTHLRTCKWRNRLREETLLSKIRDPQSPHLNLNT
jgi:hypothetical protein